GLPEGKETLTRLTELSGGVIRTDVLELFQDPPRTARTVSLLIPLMILGILLLIVEIAGRRLSLWERLRDSASGKEQDPVVASASAAQQTASGPAGWLARWQTKRRDRKTTRRQPAQKTTARASDGTPATKAGTVPAPVPKPEAPPEGENETRRSVFEQAKKRAKRRLE
nr:hypothetical protein [Planctomycetota bacterium]